MGIIRAKDARGKRKETNFSQSSRIFHTSDSHSQFPFLASAMQATTFTSQGYQQLSWKTWCRHVRKRGYSAPQWSKTWGSHWRCWFLFVVSGKMSCLDQVWMHVKLFSCWKLFEFGANDSTCFCTLRSISAKTEQIEVNKFRWFWLKTIEISSSSSPSLISSFWREWYFHPLIRLLNLWNETCLRTRMWNCKKIHWNNNVANGVGFKIERQKIFIFFTYSPNPLRGVDERPSEQEYSFCTNYS